MVAATNQVVVSNALASLVNKVNGRRRTRTLPAKWIAESAASLAPGEREFLHAGHVANAYSYPAIATAAVVYRTEDGRAFACVTTANAKRGCTGFGRRDIWTIPTNDQIEAAIAAGHTVEIA